MDMEKRAFIAILLMFLVLIFNYFLLGTRQRQVVQPPEEKPVEAAAPIDTTYEKPVEVRIEPNIAEAETITVETPLYTALISTLGGVITSFKLHNYLSPEDEPVELVPQVGSPSDSLPLAVVLHLKTGERVSLATSVFEASTRSVHLEDGTETLTLELATSQGLRVTKTLTFSGDTYLIKAKLDLQGSGVEAVRAIETGWYSGLATTEPDRKDDLRNFASVAFGTEGLTRESLGKVKKRKEISLGADLRWTGVKTKYFLAALARQEGAIALARAFARGDEAIGVAGEIDFKQDEPLEAIFYAGPLDYERLKAMGLGLEKAVDFGWRWIRPLSRLIFSFMLLVHKVVPNYGLVIIILSALTKLLFYPLAQKSFKSMRAMQRLQPEMEMLREKYKNDPQKLNKAVIELYRKHGVNPVGGCLPLLPQMPVFIALFNVLSRTIELRRAPFVLWIKDLSRPDVVASLPFSLPFIGSNISVLPILMGVAMFVQQKMGTKDPKQAMMTYFLPIVFTLMFFRFPSGLVLYWLVNNVLTICHQYLVAKSEERHLKTATGG